MGKEGNLDAYWEALELFEAVKLADASREEACEEAIQTLKGYIAESSRKKQRHILKRAARMQFLRNRQRSYIRMP